MSDDSVAAHLRAALEAAAAKEEERVRSIFDGADQQHAVAAKAMEPLLRLLTELRSVVGTPGSVSFTLPDGGTSATVATGSAASSTRLRITFEPGAQRYRIERTDSYHFADGGSHSSVFHATRPDEALKYAVELVGEHIGSERAVKARGSLHSDAGSTMSIEADDAYACLLLPGGTGSAGPCLGPMISSWGQAHGLSIVPGTLNLCSDRSVTVPGHFESLQEHAHLAQPAWRRNEPGFAPRLYPVWLGDSEQAWLYRWSEPQHLRAFVADADGCLAEKRCEIVAEVRLRDVLDLTEGDQIAMRFRD